MAKSVLDIVIRTLKEGGADKQTVDGLTKVKGAIQQAATAGAMLVASGYAIKKALDATVGTFVNYADQVRNIQRATQLSAEEASRLIQVADDLGVSYEVLEKAVKSSADSTDFSIEGLAKTSEEYLKISDANERATMAQKMYGKSWIDMVGVLEKGPATIRAGAAAIEDSLVLTQSAVDSAREYEIEVDKLSDSWAGFTTTVGLKVIPAVNNILKMANANITALTSLSGVIEDLNGIMNGTTTGADMVAAGLNLIADWAAAIINNNLPSFMESGAAATDSATTSYTAWAKAIEDSMPVQEDQAAILEAQAAAAAEISATNVQLLGLTGQMQTASETYAESYQSINADMNLTDDERKTKLAELTAEHELDTRKIILNLLEQRLAQDGLTTDELNFLLEKGLAWGIYSQTVVDEAKIAMDEVNTLTDEINGIPISKTFTLRIATDGWEAISSFGSRGSIAGPGRAAGGPVTEGTPYVVGEKGPELFVPNQSGTIIPNGGGSSIANGAAGGGSVNVSINISSPVTVMDEQNTKKVLLPYIVDGIRQAQGRGSIR